MPWSLHADCTPVCDSLFVLRQLPSLLAIGLWIFLLASTPRAEPSPTADPVSVALVVDLSGSMALEGRIDEVRRGVAGLSEHLRPRDRIALVGFNHQAQVLLPLGPPDPVIQTLLAAAEPEGATDLHAGVMAGASQLARAEGRRRLILVRDGPSNVGVLDPAALERTIEALEAEGMEVVVLSPEELAAEWESVGPGV